MAISCKPGIMFDIGSEHYAPSCPSIAMRHGMRWHYDNKVCVMYPNDNQIFIFYDDVMKWNILRDTGPLCAEFTSHRWWPNKGQWRGALMFSLMCDLRPFQSYNIVSHFTRRHNATINMYHTTVHRYAAISCFCNFGSIADPKDISSCLEFE